MRAQHAVRRFTLGYCAPSYASHKQQLSRRLCNIQTVITELPDKGQRELGMEVQLQTQVNIPLRKYVPCKSAGMTTSTHASSRG